MRALTPSERAVCETARRALDAYIPTISAKAADVNDAIIILRAWQPGTYATGDVRQHGGIPYRCVQGHDSTANPSWTPDATPALWMQYHGTSAETARPYYMRDATTVYMAGEYAIEGGKIYRCKVNNTANPPSVLPASWEAVAG